ncbi:MAG: alpha/beta fold hydrolase BchO [Erythrobacter sp.]|jgi:magnesium chelatase accessory protein|nr:alpha/beta fold hydrolase BchO [Erythrobacter sp.]
MSRPLSWEREGAIWPHREVSTFVPSGRGTWHVQRMGEDRERPRALLIHGTGSSVHSWRGLMPLLAERFDCLAPDLPRHAFTRGHPPDDTSLPRMARALAVLLEDTEFRPDIIIGHSAGAALALQLALDHRYAGPIVGLNSALRPFPGPASQLFPAIAKALFVNPLVPRLFSAAATFGGDAQGFLERSTGSRIDATGLACYSALIRNSRHTEGALAMMANWDLPTLRTRIASVANPVLLIHSTGDTAIPLDWAREAHGWLANGQLQVIERLGHLAHEEAPEDVAARIHAFADDQLETAAR